MCRSYDLFALSPFQFLRLCALLNYSTPTGADTKIGMLRLALIFRRYDSQFKGFLDNSDFDRMNEDIRAFEAANDFQRRAANKASSLASGPLRLSFECFVGAVQQNLIQ